MNGEGESTALAEVIQDTQLEFVSMEVILDDLADSVNEHDADSHALIAAAQDQHELIKSRVDELLANVTEAVDMAVHLVKEERDKAIDELAVLKDAIDDPWGNDNEDVERLRDYLLEDVETDILEMYEDSRHYDCIDELEHTLGIEKGKAQQLAYIVKDPISLLDEPLHYAELLPELIEALKRYAAKEAAG